MNLTKMALLLFFLGIFILPTFTQTSNGKEIKVNGDRIESRIFELAEFGKDQNGKAYRVAYSQGDIEGRTWFISLMKKAGLEVKIDAAGNIIGSRKGKNPLLKPIAFGSHMDMVPDGGNYDGCVGSICALEVIEVLNQHDIVTEHPLEVIIFSDEEGALTGSLGMSGKLTPGDLKAMSHSGLTVAEGISAIGGNPDRITAAIRKKGDLAAFLELHIEQGGILEKEQIEIGVVEGIVGIQDWDVIFDGVANHAGTTPMDLRTDALLAAAKFIIAAHEVINSYEGAQVTNIGKIEALPGAYNVIPGKVKIGLEIRDLSDEKIEKLLSDIRSRAETITKESGVSITFELPYSPVKSALTDRHIQELIATAAKKLNLTSKFMPSGAGHDAQDMALIAPTGMIFVPSFGGVSHSPKEFTKAIDMANGANVLLHTILALDKE